MKPQQMGVSAFYNDHEPGACAWLSQLCKRNLIARGDISRESIRYLSPETLAAYTQVHLFAGIGGWSYALRLAGWPDDRPVWTGSCPCQPFSSAGKRKGTSDRRHLWPEMFRLIGECRPGVIFGEQVAGKAGLGWLDGVFADLEGAGYACGAVVLGAHSVGAPHIRQRLFWVADSGVEPRERRAGGVPATQAGIGGARLVDGDRAERLTDGGEDRGLADRDRERCEEREESNGGAQRSGLEASRRDNAGGRGASGWMAHPERERARAGEPGVEGHAGDGDDGDQPGRFGTVEAGSVAEAGDGGGLPNPAGLLGERGMHEPERAPKGRGADRRDRPWSEFDIIPCGDGKARRLAQSCPPTLAHGVPARVVRLRGYGNAIVPQVAAEFIRAYMDGLFAQGEAAR